MLQFVLTGSSTQKWKFNAFYKTKKRLLLLLQKNFNLQ